MRRKKKNIVHEKVVVEDYAAEGKSIARVDGKVVFIERVVPGDVVDIRLFKSKKDWAEGYPLQFHSFSKERIEPFCQHFGVCGGCQWQMLPYDKQLFYKRQQVEDNLKRIGKIELPEIPAVLGADETKWYRNKLEYTFSSKRFIPESEFRNFQEQNESSKSKEGEKVVPTSRDRDGASGFHAKGLFDKVVEIERCWLQAEPTNAIRKTITEFARKSNYSFYDQKLHTGFLRTVLLRICETGEVMVNVVMAEDDKEKRNTLLEHLLKEVPGITTLLYTINTKWNDSLHDLDPVVVTGKGYVMEKLEDLQFKIGPKSFFQTNTKQAEKLYRVAREYAALTGNETVYDLYCGTGSIGIFVSKLAKKIIGVEMIADAIEDAKENATLNNIHHADFFAGDVTKICDDAFFAAHGKPDVIITDPPRAGMHEKLVKKILEIAAPVVVYVSCNPATQARDLRLLDEKYIVTKVQPVDMFPHTHHIENVAQLKLR
ncbi:MAG TPA: 23S rRNA (uracil(1939)-C(5))-methyltransferase RlmD [Chitinophagaceae bacterium]|nr:23S rRNA (uracil(1939)-C(5))-methyltransferase RlmD [Chitinophagaceae bacterium]